MDPRIDRAVRALDRIDHVGATHDLTGRWSGSDRSGAVTVTVGDAGRIRAIVLDPRWRDVLRPGELGTAIIAARTQAAEARLEAWSEAMTRPSVPPRRDGHAGLDADPSSIAPGEPGEEDAAEELTPKELSELLAAVADEMTQYRRAQREFKTATRHVTSPDGCVSVTISAERVVGVEFRRDWIKFASRADIEASAMAAITAAYAECDRIPESLDRQFPAIAAYRSYRRRM